MNVLSRREAARRAQQSLRSLERQIAVGEGPPIIRLSQRRIGIAEEDLEAWLASRRRVPPGSEDREETVIGRRSATSRDDAVGGGIVGFAGASTAPRFAIAFSRRLR
jgi:hypothetical protein